MKIVFIVLLELFEINFKDLNFELFEINFKDSFELLFACSELEFM